MRIAVPNSTGYHRQSTGENEQFQASRIALNKYDELTLKVLAGGTLSTKSFKSVFDSWQHDLPRMVTNRRQGYVEEELRLIGAYPLKFFGTQKIDGLKKGDFIDYWMWRRENSVKLNPMTKKTVPYVPSNNTLRRESTTLRNMFSYTVDKG